MRRLPWPLPLCMLAVVVALGCTGDRPTRETPLTAAAERGGQLYNSYCLSCHGGATGRSMMDIPPPHNANGHTWHHSDRQLTQMILNGTGEMGEMMRRMMAIPPDTARMPAWRGTLTEEDVAAILDYIKTWWTEEQRDWQARVSKLDR